MSYITQVLNWISTGLLLPIIVLLLLAMLYALVLLGSFSFSALTMFQERKKSRLFLKKFCSENASPEEQDKGIFSSTVKAMAAKSFDALDCEKILSDLKNEFDQDLEKSKFIAKVGPMLGLMGTLIPMGPALAGLASGDIASMAYNMQIAFATTVVGCLVAGIGLLVSSVKKHWYKDELVNLAYLLEWKLNTMEQNK